MIESANHDSARVDRRHGVRTRPRCAIGRPRRPASSSSTPSPSCSGTDASTRSPPATIAATADVSERTVYRHFPDRRALLEGLSRRVQDLGDVNPGSRRRKRRRLRSRSPFDSWPCSTSTTRLRAPRRSSMPTPVASRTRPQANTRQFREVVSDGFPDLDEREQLRIAAVIRCLVSSQAWLRMREEFGIPGAESGPGRGLGDRHHRPRAARRQPARLVLNVKRCGLPSR